MTEFESMIAMFHLYSICQDVDVEELSGGDFHAGLVASVFVTVMSELGDKSFFMSAILAMHHSRSLTFFGSMLGQIIMTGVAVGLGMAASLVPDVYTKWASCMCMTFFGLKMLKDEFCMPLKDEDIFCDENKNTKILDENVIEKYNQSKRMSEDKGKMCPYNKLPSLSATAYKAKDNKPSSKQGSRRNSTDGVFMQAFTLSFLGEWGDRSQIATIVLASNENPYGVAVGSVLGHIVCSLMAVIGGRLIGQKLPVKTMTQIGGVVFLLCAASALVLE